jgi:tetratricopeptide (TPR) repeat protein
MPRSSSYLMITALLFVVPSMASAQTRLENEASAQAVQADKLFKSGQYAAALKLYRAERESRKTLKDARYEAYALRGIGCCLVGLGDEEGAIEAFTEARSVDANREDKGFEGYDGLLIGQAQLRLGRPSEAAKSLELAIPKLGQAIDRDHECDARLGLILARLDLGEPENATGDASRAITLAEDLNDPRRLADAWLAAGLVDRDLGRLAPALERILDARDAFREQDRGVDSARAVRHLADLSYRLGRPDRAARRFQEAAEAHARLGDPVAEAEDRLDLASVRLDLGDLDAAVREAGRSRDAFLVAGRDDDAIEALVVLAQARSKSKDGLASASATINDALERSVRAHRDRPAERVRLLLLSAEIEHRLGRTAATTSRLDEATKLASQADEESLRLSVDSTRARINPKP